MEGYTLEQYYDSTFLVEHPSFTDKKIKHVIYYPCFDIDKLCSKNGIYKDWYFEIEEYPENENEEKKYSEWYLTESEREVFKDLVRKKNPEDLVEFMFEPWCEGGYSVLKKNIKIDPNTDGTVTYVVEYPIKGNSEWHFSITTEDEDGYAETEIWMLEDNKKEYIKEYIRNELKPSNLCEEGKETDMKEGYANLNVAVPKEHATEVMNIITRYDGFKVPPTTEQTIIDKMEKDNIPGDQNPLDVLKIEQLESELEQCKKDKGILADEVGNTRNSASELIKYILDSVHGEMDYDTYEDMLRNLSKEQITAFHLEEFEVKPKLKKTRFKVTKEITSYIEVITREDENALECLSWHENENDFNSLFDDNEDGVEYSYSEEHEEELTYEQAANFLDDVIIDSDLDREIRY